MREVAGQAIVIAGGEESKKFKGMINLNRTGKDVWTGLEKGLNLAEIVKKMADDYEVDENTAMQDIESMVNRLLKIGVLEN